MTRRFAAMDFDFRHLEVFSKVVELKSFSKAARSVGLAQASVSEKVANLEERMGVKLLDRLGRQVTPTRAGDLLYAHAGRLLEMKKLACLELQDFMGLIEGEVYAGASTIPGEYILPGLLGELRSRNPGINLNLSIAGSDEIIRRVLEGRIEFGVIGSTPSDANLEAVNLWKDELVVVARPGHRLAESAEISPSEFSKEPFIFREAGSGTLKTIREHFERSGLPKLESLQPAARLGSSTAVKEAIKAGAGISILSFYAVKTEVEAGLLAVSRIVGLSMTRHFMLVHDKRRTVSPLCNSVIQFLEETAGRTPPC
ncbi:MAG TPA: LysR family transcriptional regulator [Desulfobacteraceae bacterium]|nr:LysR family transcriptional regulator [Desulfobacteraceae bacterium]